MKLAFLKELWLMLFLAGAMVLGIGGCSSKTREEVLLMEEVFQAQTKLVKVSIEDAFSLYRWLNSETLLESGYLKRDLDDIAKANRLHMQFRKAVVASDSLIRFIAQEKEPGFLKKVFHRLSPDEAVQGLEGDYMNALKDLKANRELKKLEKSDAIMHLFKIKDFNPDILSRQARLVELRNQQLQLLKAEILMLEYYAARIGGDPIRCYFGISAYHVLESIVLKKGQEGRIFIGPGAQWRTDKHFSGTTQPLGFKLNGKEQSVFLNSRFFTEDSLTNFYRFGSPGFGAQILIPTSVADLGKADSAVKAFTIEWKVPVSYFRDSVISMQRSFVVRRKCQ